MYSGNNSIDVKRLRRDLQNQALGAYFSGGIGPALIDAVNVERASDDEVIRIAKQNGIDLRKYMM